MENEETKWYGIALAAALPFMGCASMDSKASQHSANALEAKAYETIAESENAEKYARDIAEIIKPLFKDCKEAGFLKEEK